MGKNSLYKPVHCGKCKHVLGKMYISVAAGVPLSLLNKYTVSRTQARFYTHGACMPALPPAESEEILRQIHPEPDEIAVNLEKIMSLLVYLKEEQDGIVRELRRVGSKCGVDDIDVGNVAMDREEDVGEGWRTRMDKLEKEMEKLRELHGGVAWDSCLDQDITLEEAMMREDSQAHPAKRRRIEKPVVESNKRIAKSSSPPFIQSRGDKSSTKPAVVLPVMNAKDKKAVVEIEQSEADQDGESSDGREEVSDSDSEDWDEEEEEEEEGGKDPPAKAEQKPTKPAQWETREHEKEREKAKQEQPQQQEHEKEKARASRTHTSIPTRGRPGLGPRRKTAGGR